MRRGVIGGVVLAALWLVFGWAPHALYLVGGRAAALGRLVPMPMYGVHGSPPMWALLVQTLTVVALIVGFALASSWISRKRVTIPSAWLAAILVALSIGVALDLGSFLSRMGTSGLRGAALSLGASSEPMAYWAVLVGWIPALVMARRAHGVDPEPASRTRVTLAPALVMLALVAVLVAIPIAAQAGYSATQERLRVEEAERQAEADPDGAAHPDPNAPGDPVPTVAPAEDPAPVGECDNENSTILAPAADAATGHRAQTIELLNMSDEPCTVNGYPDVAYGDQNGHALDVTIEHGSSFMATDPGSSHVTVQPGETAFAVIGWNANSVHEQLAARELWIAVRPGIERLTWPVSLDIIPGTTVTVTAWQESGPPATE